MASGKITGSVQGQFGPSHNFWIEWSSVADAINMQSLVAATSYLQLKPTSGNFAFNYNIDPKSKKISIDGTVATSNEKGIDTQDHVKVTIATITKVVKHDSNGYATVEIASSFPALPDTRLGSGYASQSVTLDKIDISLPNFAGEPIVFSNITQTSVDVSFTSNDDLDKIDYSLDGKNTWVNVNSKAFTVADLTPNTEYTIYVKIRKRSNQKERTSSAWKFKTLPIYVESINAPETIKVQIGKTQNLEVELLPENASIKTLSVVSSNTGIINPLTDRITTKNNVVSIPLQGIKKGYATLTISTTDGGGKTVQVNAQVVQSVTGIQIIPNTIEVSKGSIFDVVYNILPADADNKSVTITSSDTSIVEINEKTATAIENGVCSIVVKTVDGGYSATLTVNVVGDYTWYDYSTALEILNSEDVERISSNIRTIRSMLLTKGYEVSNLNAVISAKSTELVDIFDLLQNIEYNLDVINSSGIQSVYYVEPKTIGEYASNKEDIWRWLQILNDLYSILTGQRGQWGTLLCTNGYPTIDGKRILLRGDLIG